MLHHAVHLVLGVKETSDPDDKEENQQPLHNPESARPPSLLTLRTAMAETFPEACALAGCRVRGTASYSELFSVFVDAVYRKVRLNGFLDVGGISRHVERVWQLTGL
jgi:hypothetical protein